jgi:hypothetical protein
MGEEETLAVLVKEKTESEYLTEIEKIESSKQPIDVSLSLIDVLVRDFLTKKFHIPKNSEYDELVDYFLQKNKPEVATFCYEMVEALYSGEKINNQKLKMLIEDLKAIIEKEQHIAKEEKKSPFLNISKIWKKPARSARDSSSVSKQIKRFIDLELGKYEPSARPKEKENVLLEITPTPRISIKKDRTSAQYSPQLEEFSHPSIEHIDNLERIRKRIEERKKHRALYAE